MKVIVTRDSFGVLIWKEGTELIYAKPFKSTLIMKRKFSVPSEKVWMKAKVFPLFRVLFSSKKVKQLFPALQNSIGVGEKKRGRLGIGLCGNA